MRAFLLVIISVVCSTIFNWFIFEPRGFIGDSWRISQLEYETDKIKSRVTLSPTDSKYDVVTTRTGRYAVLVSDVKAYASGSKVTLKVINLYAVDRSDVKIELMALPVDEENSSSSFGKRKYIEETVGDISAGASRKKVISIPEIRPEKLKAITVSISEAGLRSRSHSNK